MDAAQPTLSYVGAVAKPGIDVVSAGVSVVKTTTVAGVEKVRAGSAYAYEVSNYAGLRLLRNATLCPH